MGIWNSLCTPYLVIGSSMVGFTSLYTYIFLYGVIYSPSPCNLSNIGFYILYHPIDLRAYL